MKKNNSMKTEYKEMLEFILSLQEKFLKESDDILAEKKELEYKKRRHEIFLEEQEKKRSPNISMFSPLSTEDMYETEAQLRSRRTKVPLYKKRPAIQSPQNKTARRHS